MPFAPLSFQRLLRLLSRVLCLAAPPIVVLAFWDPHFYPLAIKEILTETVGLAAFLFWKISKPGNPVRTRSGLANPLAWPLLALCLWSLVTIFWTGPREQAIHHWASFAGLLLLVPPTFDFCSSPVFRRSYRNMVLVLGTLLLILAAFQINGISLGGLLRVTGGNSRTRVSLTIGHNNGVAPVVLMTSFIALGALVTARNLWVRAGLALTCAASWILIVFFLLTRSTILGLLAGGFFLVVLTLYRLVRSRRTGVGASLPRWAKPLLGFGLAGALLLVASAGYLATRGGAIEGTFNPNLARNITDRIRTLNPQFLMRDSRARLWAAGVYMMKHHPLLGLGFSSAKYDYPLYQAVFFEHHPDYPAGPTGNHTERLHNDYLQWAAETGAIGLTLLLWALLAFAKAILGWLNRSESSNARFWWWESCALIALLTLLMDACFSFTGHIAPIAIYFPGLLALWFGSVSRPARAPEREPRVAGKTIAIRLVTAAAVWTIVAIPVGMTESAPAWLSQKRLWTPILAQVHGRYWHARVAVVRKEFDGHLKEFSAALNAGERISPREIENLVKIVRDYRRMYEKFPPNLFFAGEALYGAGTLYDEINVFFTKNRAGLFASLEQEGGGRPIGKFVSGEMKEALAFLGKAEELYQESLKNYRYHTLYTRLGKVQLDLAQRKSTPSALRKGLVDSGRSALETGRRIFPQNERFFAELDVALRVGDDPAGTRLMDKLLQQAPDYFHFEILPKIRDIGIREDPKTGKKRLDRYTRKFFQLLLPRLNESHGGLLMTILTVLDGTDAKDLIGDYCRFAKTILPPEDTYFLTYRMLKETESLDDLSDELETFRELREESPNFNSDKRLLYLSDLQRFAPETADLSGWREEVASLQADASRPVPSVMGYHCLALEAFEKGHLIEAWKLQVEADARTSIYNRTRVDGRRNASLDMAFWGVAWPWIVN